MPLTNLLGEREALTKNSDLYKEKIVEYMEGWGYILVADSSSQGGFADLVFEKPETHGNRQAVVEAKWTDLGRFEKSFMAEYGKYFLHYMKEPIRDRFDFFIFARELKNLIKWRHLFDISLQRHDDVENYFERIMENDKLDDDIRGKLENYDLDEFEQFVGDTRVVQADFDSLSMKIEEYEDSDKFKPQFYITESEPINDPEELTANFVLINDLPEKLFIGEAQDVEGPQIPFEGKPYAFPTYFKGGTFYNLISPEDLPDATTQFVVDGSLKELNFEQWVLEDGENKEIAKILLRELALYDALDRGVSVKSMDRGYRIYFEHQDSSEEKQRRYGRQVTRYYKEGSSPFVWHLAAGLSVREFSEDFYIVISPKFLFSDDGSSLIRGASNKPLYDRFSTSRWQNNGKIRDRVEFWFEVLGYGEPVDDPQTFTTQLVNLSLDKRPPSNVSIRDQSMEHRTIEEFR